jgi:predicted TIM-barrel fold metal-dependent hydrolase
LKVGGEQLQQQKDAPVADVGPDHVIDFHTHIFPDKIVDRAVEALRHSYHVAPVVRPTVSGLLETMDSSGIDVSVSVPVATRPDQVRSINEWAAEVQRQHPDRLVCFGALHPGLYELASEVDHIGELGLKGIKLQPNFQECSPNDARLFPAYEAAAELGLIVLFHSGQEIKEFDQVYSTPAALADVHARFPQLTMVIAHLGGYQMWGEVRQHLLGEQVYLDASYCPPEQLPDHEFLNLVRSHGTDRVVFGSDFPWSDPGRDLDRLRGLPLLRDELGAIAWRNAASLLRADVPVVSN